MYYELALILVAIVGGYWGWHFVRQDTLRLYGVLTLAAALLALLGFIGERTDDDTFGVPGAIGVGAGACLLVLGPMARGLARRAAAAERFAIAQRLLDIAEVLAPGSGVGDEKVLLAAMREIRDGNIEQTVEALTAAKFAATPEARLAIDERIAMLYLAAYRWDEAIAHAEENLFGAIAPASETSNAPNLALRRALGIAPPVWVELLGAYGYTGNLEQAARMLARLEDVCADRPDGAMWLHRGRLIFLAFAGRVDAVQALVDPRRSRHMKPAARTYWLAIAHERQGALAEAEAAYTRARSRSRGRPRVLIDQALARLPTAKPADLGPTASEVVTRVEAAPVPEVAQVMRPRGPWATRSLVFAMIAAAAAISIAFGPTGDLGVLVRDGALVRDLVHQGEWWRLVTCVFVHVGSVHLLVNVIGLWFLGRFSEELFGPWRTLAIFALAAAAGTAASFLATPAGISAGASGAVFGLLGAVFVELTWQRKRHRTAWSRGVWGSLAVVTVAQIGIGFLYPVTDQWAHVGGLAAGAVAGFVLSPHVRWRRFALHAARAIALAFAALAIVAAVMVARTPLAESLTRSQLERRDLSTVSVVVPRAWQRAQDELYSADIYMVLQAHRVATPLPVADAVDELAEGERTRAKDKQFERVEAAPDTSVPLPDGWHGRELLAAVSDPLGTEQRFRVVVAGRPDDAGHLILASLYVPERIAQAAPGIFSDMVGSIRAR